MDDAQMVNGRPGGEWGRRDWGDPSCTYPTSRHCTCLLSLL